MDRSDIRTDSTGTTKRVISFPCCCVDLAGPSGSAQPFESWREARVCRIGQAGLCKTKYGLCLPSPGSPGLILATDAAINRRLFASRSPSELPK